ncbi:MAG: ABC transporter substrate-binding protein, partial [Brachymonas sp.]|nr:ABC transporter substrate-binding protein [Brachymonas sp.]
MKLFRLAPMGALSLSLLLAACGQQGAEAPKAATSAPPVAAAPARAKSELVRNNGSEPETLDPSLASSVPANNIIRDMFEGLTAVDNKGNPTAGVAESWEQTDPTTWVFKLRQNAKWSNGDPVKAGDFVYGMQRLVTPATASKYADTYGTFLLNGKEVIAGQKQPSELGVKAIDDYTLEV